MHGDADAMAQLSEMPDEHGRLDDIRAWYAHT
jgi:hypothetical protein